MAKKLTAWKTKGMNQDLSVSAFNPEFAFENMNLRLSTNEGNTLMSWVNEKGTEELLISGITIKGAPVGTAVINSKLVLFTHSDENDHIYVLEYDNISKTIMKGTELYYGKLNFSIDNPLETLVSYESEKIQKVYWVDGVNQPRMVNIAGDIIQDENLSKQFDFVSDLELNEEVKVKKLLGASGSFAPGVIQYAFTYYNKYGHETNIFYTTPLYYISYADRGASPEDKVENAFQITVENVEKDHFDFLRIYSIQRTSINATPFCKRVADVELGNMSSVTYVDTGYNGDSIDPTELLYKGGEVITAGTMEQKDGTLFLGDLLIKRPQVTEILSDYINSDHKLTSASVAGSGKRSFIANEVSTGSYEYANQLTAYADGNKEESVPCGGFKRGDVYRCGVQFQHKSGKWSEPVWIQDVPVSSYPTSSGNTISVPILEGTINSGPSGVLINKGYIKARPVVVFPEMQDRNVICQGVACPTLFTAEHHTNKDLWAQSSWFFRPVGSGGVSSGAVAPIGNATGSNLLPYTSISKNYIPEPDNGFNIRQVEIQGDFDLNDKFWVGNEYMTLHSADIEFNDQLATLDYTSVEGKYAGYVKIENTLSDIDIQTETPTIGNNGAGFVHKSFSKSGMYGIVSGLFYDDLAVDDNQDEDKNLMRWDQQKSPFKWMVYLWNKEGSLNNDVNRPADRGVRTAKLKKKVISNLRYASTQLSSSIADTNYLSSVAPQLFSSDQVSILKFGDEIYQGNIDTMLTPSKGEGYYFAFNNNLGTTGSSDDLLKERVDTPIDTKVLWKLFSDDENSSENAGLWRLDGSTWNFKSTDIGNTYVDLVRSKESVRMKYKSTAHLVMKRGSNNPFTYTTTLNTLPVLEITHEPTKRFGGNDLDALKANKWIPCGKPVKLNNTGTTIYYEYGDTYYQRYDCLKTYAFTPEDTNQVVEIGSFMLETRVNIDGRYDRNRGQLSNLNMSPRNFNLMNPVYSQTDNFFTYQILDDDHYNNVSYPNQVTWSKTKNSGEEVDQWTNITLASVLEFDGDKGKVNKLIRLNNQLFCFQDTGISHILYNENVQIQTTQGVPVELANSGKVQGKDYKSNTIGCSNKWSMVTTPSGIYFMDSNDKTIYLFNGQLNNISAIGGFNTWCKKNIPSMNTLWTPEFPLSNEKSAFTAFYDKMNQDVLYINSDTALAFSEKLQAFTSFYDYGNSPFFCNLDDTGIWIRNPYTYTPEEEGAQPVSVECKLWKHQAGNYCQLFGTNKSYWMTLIANPEPTADKIFTNLEFRACVEGEGKITGGGKSISTFDETFDYTFRSSGSEPGISRYIPFLPVDYLETWNEYQHGKANLQYKNGHQSMLHHIKDMTAHLDRKFRIWRCDIPRDNYKGESSMFDKTFDFTFQSSSRKTHPTDRMRNPWLYIKLKKNAADIGKVLRKTELHDIIVTYYT